MTDNTEALPPLPEQLAATFIGYVEGLLGVCRVPSHVFEAFEQRADEFRAALTAAPSAQAEPSAQEPVVWVKTWHKGKEQHAELWEWEEELQRLPDGYHALYAAPPIAQAEPSAQAEPPLPERQNTSGRNNDE